MHRFQQRHIAYTFIGITIVISVVILVTALVHRAEHAEHRADTAETEVSDTRADLYMAEQTLDATQVELDGVQAEIATMSAEVQDATAVSTRLSGRDRACRFVVKVSDELLDTSIVYGKISNHLMNSREGHAADLTPRASAHLQEVNRLVEESGFKNISALYDACTPKIDEEIAAAKLGR